MSQYVGDGVRHVSVWKRAANLATCQVKHGPVSVH